MIHLLSVAKSYTGAGSAPNVVFRPTNLSLPADRTVVILGERREGKSVLLQLLAGAEPPDKGRVIAPVRLSPVVNARSVLHPQLTVLENIRFLARLFGMNSDRLAAAVDAICGIGPLMFQPVKIQDPAQRRTLEAAVVLALPFDCYLIDSVGSKAPEGLELSITTANRRQAGVIFATSQSKLARQFASFVVVIRDHTLYPFNRVGEAIRFYEQRPRQ
jgi:capsular polysaccharide transport system ATP-binding protein